MSALAFGIVSAALVASAALLGAASLRLRSLPELAVAAYVLAVTEVLCLVLVLSPLGAVRRSALIAGMLAVLAAALVTWVRLGHPAAPGSGEGGARLRDLRRSTTVIALLVAVGLAAAYVVVLALATPPVTWDSLRYHLTRAALWRQDGAVGYIADAYDTRLNANPPNAEVLQTFVLELARDETLTAFVQFSAWLACFAAVVALARRIGLTRAEAAFGGAVFLLLPIVVLQSSTTQNDLVVASLLLAATVFATRDSWRELALAGVAVGLAVGTKVTVVYAAPIVLAVVLLSEPRRAWARRTAALAVGTAAGAYWYGLNTLHTTEVLGGTPDRGHVEALTPLANVVSALARLLDTMEVTGVQGWGAYAYVIGAALFGVALLVLSRSGRVDRGSASIAAALVFVPLLLFPLSYATWRAFAKLQDVSDVPDDVLPVAGWQAQTLSSEEQSWFGPVGLLLAVGVGSAALVLVRRRRLPVLAAVFATAPLVWFLLVSVTLRYDPWQGRFFVYPVALSAALWGLALRRPPVAWATAAVAVTIAALTLVRYDQKPLSVWPSAERWSLQSRHRPKMQPLLQFLEQRVAADATVALALRGNEWGYPAFGPRVERRVVLVPRQSRASGIAADWLFADLERIPEVDLRCWTPAVTGEEGTIYARDRAACPDLER